jgi:hypothetical protein
MKTEKVIESFGVASDLWSGGGQAMSNDAKTVAYRGPTALLN